MPRRVRAHARGVALRPRAALDGAGDRAQPDRRGGRPGAAQRRRARAIADHDFTTELAQFNVEINIPPRLLTGDVFAELEQQVRDSLNAAEDKARGVGAHMMLVGILPTISDDAPQRRALQREPALQAPQRADLRRPRGGPADLDHRPRAAVDVRRHDRARGGLHERAAAPAGRPRALPHALERRAGDRRRAARDRRQLAVLLRPRAVAGDADRAVRAGHRHAPGGAQGAGRAPARVVRRALDHLDLRPLRGERHLLPGAAAGVRAGGPGRGARARRRARSSASCACTTAPSTAGTGRSTTSCAASRTCGSRTASSPPARPSSTRSPTPPSTTGSCGC